jgi:hypothetical protein
MGSIGIIAMVGIGIIAMPFRRLMGNRHITSMFAHHGHDARTNPHNH